MNPSFHLRPQAKTEWLLLVYPMRSQAVACSNDVYIYTHTLTWVSILGSIESYWIISNLLGILLDICNLKWSPSFLFSLGCFVVYCMTHETTHPVSMGEALAKPWVPGIPWALALNDNFHMCKSGPNDLKSQRITVESGVKERAAPGKWSGNAEFAMSSPNENSPQRVHQQRCEAGHEIPTSKR